MHSARSPNRARRVNRPTADAVNGHHSQLSTQTVSGPPSTNSRRPVGRQRSGTATPGAAVGIAGVLPRYGQPMDTTSGEPYRAFAVSPTGTVTELMGSEAVFRHMGVSPALSAAYDVLDDVGLARDDRVELLVAAERSGNDPEAFARHLVKLCRVAGRQS